MLSPRAQAFSVQSLLADAEEQDHKRTAIPLHPNTERGKNEASWSPDVLRCELNSASRSPRPEEASWCDAEHTSLCRHSAIVTSADGQGAQREGVSMELCQNDLWHAFHALGTEMIITRSGRRMFPAIRLHVTGLEPSALYRVSLEFAPCGPHKYRYIYHSSKWMVAGVVEGREGGGGERTYPHPDGPLTGHRLTSQSLTFDKVKLTNCTCPSAGQVSLTSMRKFQPKIHIDKVLEGNGSDVTNSLRMTFIFPQTSFMAVTAYQNHQITQLKIARNPFAKGFRHISKHKNSLPLTSHGLPLFSCWPPGTHVYRSPLPGDSQPWKQLNPAAHSTMPSPVRGPNMVQPFAVYDTTPPQGCLHPVLQGSNRLPLPVSSLPVHPPILWTSYQFPKSENFPSFLNHHQPVNFNPVRAWKHSEVYQDVTLKRDFKMEDGAASSSGCDVAMLSPVGSSVGDTLDLCQSR